MNEVLAQPAKAVGGLGRFERYLSIWVALCMVAGVALASSCLPLLRACAGLK